MLLGVGTQPDTVPRDPVWKRAREYDLPRAEYVRMGGPEAAVGSRSRNPRATMSRSAAISLLGELVVDKRWPLWGEHRAALAGVPCARKHPQFPVHSVEEADSIHRSLVRRMGKRDLAAVLAAG
jgi:hypothetical protein